MKSEDDPEARIRELEQPLADAAHASEATANPSPTKWAPPSGPPTPPAGPPMSPPPPLPYDGSFLGPRTRSTSGSQTRWILLALFVIGVIALPIAIFLFSAHQISRSLPSMVPIPSFSSPGLSPSGTVPGSSAAVPTQPSSMTAAPAGENVIVSGISEVRTIACNGGSVSVSGITNNVVITGHCISVMVSGIQNQVVVDTADRIQASGSNNHVAYHTGSPKIGNSGIGNTVQRG